jgi:ribulose-phosphate 3-epimerase
MPITIVPAIIGSRFEEIQEKIGRVARFAEWVQIDVVDGLFASPASWPYKQREEKRNLHSLLHRYPKLKIELHLMIENPESEIDQWMETGVSRILFHIESTPRVSELIDHCETPRLGMNGRSTIRPIQPSAQVGIVLNLDTAPEKLETLMQQPTFIQCMSIATIGSYGATFNDRVFLRLEYLRRKYPHATLSVDGGVSLENASELVAAGANQLIVGSALWKSKSPERAFRELTKTGLRG